MPQRRWIEYADVSGATPFRLPHNPSRRAVVLSNNSDTDMRYRVGDDATADVGVALPAGLGIALDGDLCPEGEVTLFCASTGKAYTVYEVVG